MNTMPKRKFSDNNNNEILNINKKNNEINKNNKNNDNIKSNVRSNKPMYKKQKNIVLNINKPPNPDSYYYVINKEINELEDLIKLGYMYNPYRVCINIDLFKIFQLIPYMEELNKMIGMNKFKKAITDQIIYSLQGFENDTKQMMHSIIYGEPGVGKSTVVEILAKIYVKLGFVQNETVIFAKRSDLIAEYLGQTTIKTQKLIDAACKNGGSVLVIDEAYSLGNKNGKDSYSKECIDCLNQNLSENKNNFICILAGYEEDIKNCFFKVNRGLERRFPFRYTLDKYEPKELMDIFRKKVYDNKWKLYEDALDIKFFEKNKDAFLFNGGDMETLFLCTKLAHSKRVFMLHSNMKKNITSEDIEEGFKKFLENDDVKKRLEKEDKTSFQHMYM